jgi:hypothetical protein
MVVSIDGPSAAGCSSSSPGDGGSDTSVMVSADIAGLESDVGSSVGGRAAPAEADRARRRKEWSRLSFLSERK